MFIRDSDAIARAEASEGFTPVHGNFRYLENYTDYFGITGKVDGILLTGGIAFNAPVVDYIRDRCSFLAPITVYPGENELEALAINALVVLRGVVEPKIYR